MNSGARPYTFTGGRFDSVDGTYAYTYLGEDEEAAIAETMCRSLPFDGHPRLLPRAQLRGAHLSSVMVTADLTVVSLCGADVTQVGQDIWLTTSGPSDYRLTRLWADAIRTWVPGAGGLTYRGRHDNDRHAWALFGHPSAPDHPELTHTGHTVDLDDDGIGTRLVTRVLQRHNATLSRQ